MNFNDKISTLNGVGATYEKRFSENGIFTVGDLLYHFPRAYQNRGDVCRIIDTPFDFSPHSYVLTVGSEPKAAMIRRGMTLLKFKAFDDSGSVNITYFNQNYLKDVFKIGSSFRFYGKLSREKRVFSMTSPAYEPIIPNRPLMPLIPVYPLFNGISQKLIGRLISEVIAKSKDVIEEYLPSRVLDRMNLCSLPFALRNIHTPPDENTLNAAIRRLSFDEFFLFAMSVSLIKSVGSTLEAPAMTDTDVSDFINMLPYELTDAQARAVGEILTDLSGGRGEKKFTKQMNRIIVGDVGSGKTVCAEIAAYAVCKNGYQTALMVPTEILAVQHYNSIKKDFAHLGYSCELLTGSTPSAEKRRILQDLKTGRTDLIIGTHALIQSSVEFSNLGLVITDEQHRFGVRQRARLAEKSKNAHVLVMSATPIPRTLSLMIYGDLDISLIDTMPPGRKRVDTFVVDEGYRERLNAFIRKQVNEGHQVYIVCPSVEEKSDDILDFFDYNPFIIHDNEKEKGNIKAAVPYAKELKDEIFPDLNIEFIHGKLKGKEKDKIMMDFASGRIDVLVSTTVIEVGVNVPNATLMIVENAERFGLSQLHQLRGRVGRGADKSYCILVSSSKSERSVERLEIMRTTYDGYTIAERDLKMRGPGDFFSQDPSIRQSGQINFTLSGSCSDTSLLLSAFECAKEVLDDDKDLLKDENAVLRSRLKLVAEHNAKTVN